MKKIYIKRNSDGDTRTANKTPTIAEFSTANNMHREDVKKLMIAIASEIEKRGINHDYTKVREPYRTMFYRDLCDTLDGKMSFLDGEWSKSHYEIERHHLNRRCPDDVNLIDVIEMICDCVCAGLARSSEFKPFELSNEVLQKALKNTMSLCAESVLINED